MLIIIWKCCNKEIVRTDVRTISIRNVKTRVIMMAQKTTYY